MVGFFKQLAFYLITKYIFKHLSIIYSVVIVIFLLLSFIYSGFNASGGGADGADGYVNAVCKGDLYLSV